MLHSRTGAFVFVAIVIIGCLGAGVWLSISERDAPPLVISVALACAISALLYGILGGVGKSGFEFGPLKMGCSAAVLVGSAYLFNLLLEPQLDAIRAVRVEAILDSARFDVNRHIVPARGWFAIDRITAEPVSVRFLDPVTDDEVVTFVPPARANLRFRLAEQENSGDRLVAGVYSETWLGYVTQQNLESMLGRIDNLEPGTTYGPYRLHLVNEGELSPDNPREWGSRRCLGTRMPLLVQVNRFEDDFADYEVSPCDSDQRVESSLRPGQGELHRFTIDGESRSFVIAVVAADHRTSPFWSSFLVMEMVPARRSR
ncbi:MAG: hypothetical protein F4234_06010 [Gammaproteobacteria bacterium]|nr:hypothetical protein [Gammaproteobacteria bacterium]